MTTVHAVTSDEPGEPNYRIRAVFSARELADDYRAECLEASPYDRVFVEGWRVDAEAGARATRVHYVNVDLISGRVEPFMVLRVVQRPDTPPVVDGPRPGRHDAPQLTVGSPVSEEHAREVAAEWRRRWLRLNPGPPASGSPAPCNSNRP